MVSVFLKEPLEVGQTLSLTMKSPGRFFVRGRVISCYLVNSSQRVIQEDPTPYRVVIRFEFRSKEEVQAVAHYYSSEIVREVYREL